MSRLPPAPPMLGRLILRLCRLGDRRAEVLADLHELLMRRTVAHGLRHARRRFIADAFSVWLRPPQRPRRFSPGSLPVRMLRWLTDIPSDTTFAVRIFRRQAGVVTLGILGLAVAIGLTTTVFTIANTFNFKPLGVPQPDEVVHVYRTIGPERRAVSGWTVRDVAALNGAARSIALESSAESRLTMSRSTGADGRPSAWARFVSSGFFSTFGGSALVGRLPAPEDYLPGAAPVVVLNHQYWKTAFEGDRSLVGQTASIAGKPVTVIGVLSPEFSGPFEVNRIPAMWLPLLTLSAVDPFIGSYAGEASGTVGVVGRLRGGATLAQAESELAALAAGLPPPVVAGPLSTDSSAELGVRLQPAGSEFTREDLLLLTLFLTIAGLVVLLAATNVANLLLAGATLRAREIGARLALGASRARIVRQLLTESVLLALVAGGLGLLATKWFTALAAYLFVLPPTLDLAADGRVFLFVAVVSILAGISAGLKPALHGSRGSLTGALNGGAFRTGAGAGRTRPVFVGMQAAVSVLLLVMTALFTRALIEVAGRQPGFDPARVLTVTAFPLQQTTAALADREFFDLASARLLGMPGVEQVVLAEHAPYESSFHSLGATLDGRPYRVLQNWTSSGYFDMIGGRRLEGRTYSDDEVAAGARVAVITAGLARDFWPDGSALGSTLGRVSRELGDVQVIGVVNEATPFIGSPRYSASQFVYQPLVRFEATRLIVRLSDPALASPGTVRAALAPLDTRRLLNVRLVQRDLENGLQGPRILATTAAIVGGMAVLLAVVGVFGVTAFAVQQRRREIGIRMAIGAETSAVVMTMFRDGMRPVVIGLITGLVVAVLAAQGIEAVLYGGISPRDPWAFAAGAGALLVTAGVAVLIPARRAARIDPALSLRAE